MPPRDTRPSCVTVHRLTTNGLVSCTTITRLGCVPGFPGTRARGGGMPANPNRSNAKPAPGSRFLSSAVAQNVRAARRRRELTQEQLSLRMKQLGHETWSYQTVGEVERDNRSLSVDELFSLSAALSTALTDLLDPTGLNGENNEAI